MPTATQQQLDTMQKSLDEIKRLLGSLDGRVRELENKQASNMPLTNREISSLKSHQKEFDDELAALEKSVILLESTVKQQAKTVETLSNALPEMANFVRHISTWLKWIGGIVALLIGAGLIFWLGWR